MTDRDRDESGRARNARPRDALGRPLPPGSAGVPRIPDDLLLPPAESLDYAQRLLDEGLAFHAHEVLEAAWKQAAPADRQLWQGLAQLAVGITHVQRGNPKGATTLLHRAILRIDGYHAHDIDVPGLIGFARGLLDDLDAGRAVPPHRLVPKLRIAPERG